jgi:hypothetical protein
MTFLRLLPRLLLCTLFGALVFCAASWVLRPRPNWSVDLGDFKSPDFTDGETNPSADEPIWVTLTHANGPVVDSIAAFHPKTGKLLKRLEAGEDFNSLNAHRMADGRLLTAQYKDFPEDHPKAKAGVVSYSEFAFNDAFSNAPPVIKTFDRTWFATDDGRRAWAIDSTKSGFRITVADLATGARLHALECSHEYPHFSREQYQVSPDARWIVVCETARDPARRPAGLDVWDIETGAMTRRVYPPQWLGPASLQRIKHVDFVSADWIKYFNPISDQNGGTGKEAIYDLKRDAHLDPSWSPQSPESSLCLSMHAGHEEKQVWTAQNAATSHAWFALFDQTQMTTPWRPVNVAFASSGYTTPDAGFGKGEYSWRETGLAVWRVPGKDQFVALALQPALVDVVPETIYERLPDSWKSDVHKTSSFWNDGKGSRWCAVGLSGEVEEIQLRSNAVLVIFPSGSGRQLQSWPLPPRDPCLPSALIALALAAAVWWLLARRALRKQKLSAQ